MKPRITLLTLGVDDLDRALKFYRDGLGFPTRGIVGTEFEHGAVAFFELQPGLQLAIWPRADIAHDVGIVKTDPSPTEFTIGHNVASEQEVDSVMQQAKRAGARIVKPAAKTFWGGYAGYFQDPDGQPPQPPAMAPTTSRGSTPFATGSGSGASGGSWERSCSQAKNRTNGRRRWVVWPRIVPRSTG